MVGCEKGTRISQNYWVGSPRAKIGGRFEMVEPNTDVRMAASLVADKLRRSTAVIVTNEDDNVRSALDIDIESELIEFATAILRQADKQVGRLG